MELLKNDSPHTKEFPFNIRVYGVCLQNNHILLSDEIFKNNEMTKFPGGGLNYGEGTVECLKREFMEEFDLTCTVKEHLYTTDFFQPAFFYKKIQLISIYYYIDLDFKYKIPISTTPEYKKDTKQMLRWHPVNKLNHKTVTFPVDKKVVELLINREGTY
ncbi:NUDIX domain-containing protein [Marinilabiliaceae bacterium ANBcel2]|nr:NUDIX domain-containing protein [Marinilabiliaceae bacterium ANBcel2]